MHGEQLGRVYGVCRDASEAAEAAEVTEGEASDAPAQVYRAPRDCPCCKSPLIQDPRAARTRTVVRQLIRDRASATHINGVAVKSCQLSRPFLAFLGLGG